MRTTIVDITDMPSQARHFNRCPPLRRLLAGTILALALAGNACAGDNPGYDRPGIGFSPSVLSLGDFTWEQGLPDWSKGGGTSLYTVDTLLRLGIGGPLELQVGTSWNHVSAPGFAASGRGDSSVGLKFALPVSGAFSWGVLGSATFTDGARDFRGADRQYLLGVACNWQVNARDALGAYVENVHAGSGNNTLVAVNAGRTLNDGIGVYAELAWQHAADHGSGAMAGAGVTWQVSPRVQLDASFRHRLSGEADTWQAGVGVSVFFGS